MFAYGILACALETAAQQPAIANHGQAPAPGAPGRVSPDMAPIAIVPVEGSATVTGGLEVSSGKAVIVTSGTIASGAKDTDVILPRRGTLRVCASTTVKLARDTSVPDGETPGLMMALDHGAIEASFATGRNADTLLTPDFRILISAPGASDLKVRLGQHGDTCVDNPVAPGSSNAPYVIVTSVFDGGAYRVQPGQRVMFQHGSLQEVVDNEKEPCGCPPEARPGTNDFPLAESAGLAPSTPSVTVPAPVSPAANLAAINEPLVYPAQPAVDEHAANPSTPVEDKASPVASPTAVPAASHASQPPPKKQGFLHRMSSFFKKIFGAE
jgi:hypothetical protein